LLKFWPKHGSSVCSLSPQVVWTEIYSKIKGSQQSSDYVDKGLPRKSYLETKSLHPSQLESVYNIYVKYEAWKKEIKGFDFMDLVNHILRSL